MRKNYYTVIINTLLRSGSPIINIFEKPKIRHFASLDKRHQPIFIIGAPRAGSTIVYQALSNIFDLLYIDNLVCKFFRNLYFGFWLSHRLFSQKPHNCFFSYHGTTSSYGLSAPSECGEFWYRWLPRDRHYINSHDISKGKIKEIRDNIYSVMNRHDKPLLFKNMNAGQRLRLISEIAPNAKFIFVKRDPLYTAQSILVTRQQRGIKSNGWWSIKPRNFKELLSLDYHEQIVKQVFFIEKQIWEDVRYFPKENFIIVNYRDFCFKHDYIMSEIHGFIGRHIKKRKDAKPAEIRFSREKFVSNEDFMKFEKEINKLDWNNYVCNNEEKDGVILYDSQGTA